MPRTARVSLFGLVFFACGPGTGSEVTAGSSETSGPDTAAASTSEVPTSGASLTDAPGTSGDSCERGSLPRAGAAMQPRRVEVGRARAVVGVGDQPQF